MASLYEKDLNELSTSYSIRQQSFKEFGFFSYISYILYLITPKELPIDVLHNAVHANASLSELFEEALKLEAGFICIMAVTLTMCLVPFGFTVAWCCKITPPKTESEEHVDPLMSLDDSTERALIWKKRASIGGLFVMFLLMISCDVGIFIANSQLFTSLDVAPNIVKTSIQDVELYLKKTHIQVKNYVDTGFDVAVKQVIDDLEDIDLLLGNSIKTEVSANTGIELAFDSLSTISSANTELITRVSLLHESISKSLKISQEAAARMEELQIQLSVLQRQCTFRDRPLCDTLRIRSFEENGIIEAFKQLQEDQGIFQMRYLGEVEIGTSVRSLSQELAISKSIFGNFPAQVKSDTITQRNDTIEQLETIKIQTASTAQTLTQIIVSLLDQLSGLWESIEDEYLEIKNFLRTFWGFGWSTGMTIACVLIFILMTFCCTCCNSNVKAGVLLITSVIFICVGSIVLTIFVFFSLAVGGNGEIFLCSPLYYQPDYDSFGKVFDKPGLIYSQPKPNGVLSELLKPPQKTENIVNVSLAKALRDCEEHKSSYNVFKLATFINRSRILDLNEYPKVNDAIYSITVSEKTLLSLTEMIRYILQHMLKTVELNLTAYRTSISQPTPEKDLSIFIDQMQRVSLQIQDVPTSSRMTTLGSRAKRLQASVLQPLEQLRSEILYHLTALELQKEPWARQVNHTLHHLKNIQNYLENTAKEICQNETENYINRLKAYLTTPEDSVPLKINENTSSCRPLFDVFDVNRAFICHNIIDSVNGLGLLTFVCLFFWSLGTPVALNLITLHNKMKAASGLRHTSSHLYGTPPDTLLISEQSNWGAPSSTQPARMDRHDSVRSVRWETTEISFDDDDSPNYRENLV